jgi:hypothetical protein
MKKLVYVAALLLMANCLGGCKGKSSKGTESSDTMSLKQTQTLLQKTLNGFDSVTATNYIKNFSHSDNYAKDIGYIFWERE